jgi:hypothetical protein
LFRLHSCPVIHLHGTGSFLTSINWNKECESQHPVKLVHGKRTT